MFKVGILEISMNLLTNINPILAHVLRKHMLRSKML